LEAMRRLGARSITALIVPKREVAWQILALNTEKAHNLRERSLEVIRIYRGLVAEDSSRAEQGFAFYLEEASLVTLGCCYDKKPAFAGGAYHPILRKLEGFEDAPLKTAVKQHEKRAEMVLNLEEKVSEVVKRLKDRGLTSPYLRTFVVARINPLRWIKGEPPPLEDVLKTMRERAAKFNVEKIKQEDLASMAGAPGERLTSLYSKVHPPRPPPDPARPPAAVLPPGVLLIRTFLIAKSKTSFNPFWVRAEHSMYFTALISDANCSPCAVWMGDNPFSFKLSKKSGSSRKSTLVPTKMLSVGQ